jgi:transposase
MFWGAFYGDTKGPCLFWEKEWGSIDSEKYCQRIVPLIDGFMQQEKHEKDIDLLLMQDSAPGHASVYTRRRMANLGFQPIYWPAKSPDLNPIESIWDDMKDWVDERLPSDDRDLPYSTLRELVQGAWDSIPAERFYHQISTMPARCQAVLNANGGHIRY